MTQQHQIPQPVLPDPFRQPPKRSKLWLLITLQALSVAALLGVVAYYTLVAPGPAAAPQPKVTVYTTVTATPKPVAPSRIVTLEDIIQGCADALVKQGDIPLYTDRPKACVQLGEPEFRRASSIAMPLIMAQYDTPAP